MTASTQIQQAPYLREQRSFPRDDVKNLSKQVDQAYIDIASKVNLRTISTYATDFPVITGENYFFNGEPRKQQTFRQMYTFTSTAAITHGITNLHPNDITHPWGGYTDNITTGNNYGIIYATSVAIPGQITFYVTNTQIVFVVGAGAPALAAGRINLEWLSSVDTNS
jgi:hypothetical protein